MKKIIFLILIVVGISYGQSGNPIVDSLTAHRTDINLNATNHDTLATDVQTNTTNVALKSNIASPTFTGTVTIPTLNITSAFQIDEAPLTANISELNILDGVTSTASELNILDGVTATAAELNFVDGVTSNIQTQINAITAAQGDVIVDSINADVRFFSVTLQYPTASENVALFLCPYDITIQNVNAAVSGTASCSSKVNIQFGATRATATSEVFNGDQWVSSTTGVALTGNVYDQFIDGGQWVWVKTSGLVGTVYDLIVTATYTKR